jgi:hypothetical protein
MVIPALYGGSELTRRGRAFVGKVTLHNRAHDSFSPLGVRSGERPLADGAILTAKPSAPP